MNKGIFWTVSSCVAFIAIVLGLFLNRFITPSELSISQYKDLQTYILETPRNLSGFSLVNDKGKAFEVEDFEGHWNILFFGFTNCPDICPVTMKQLAVVREQLRENSKKIRFFLVSVDPLRDTPRKLRIYLDNFHAEFVGLTGEIDHLYRFATQVNAPFSPVTKSKDNNYSVDHYANLVLVNPDGKYAGFFRSPHRVENINKSLESLLR
ncbi:MAG: hypothetical protein CMB53_00900 [Euryarchaeota archaeon]|nr:hypothetical protein [Euryarchaeota archaeon]|tara:strand:- start:1980 stop:2606 length:627 start_codon:yes stop_codon:yes gene_type:complete